MTPCSPSPSPVVALLPGRAMFLASQREVDTTQSGFTNGATYLGMTMTQWLAHDGLEFRIWAFDRSRTTQNFEDFIVAFGWASVELFWVYGVSVHVRHNRTLSTWLSAVFTAKGRGALRAEASSPSIEDQQQKEGVSKTGQEELQFTMS